MDFILNGQKYALTKSQVEAVLRRVEPESGDRHFVEVGDREYPIKQAFSLVLQISRLDFNTQQARGIFRRLGFKVLER
jgi:hypothetical protein